MKYVVAASALLMACGGPPAQSGGEMVESSESPYSCDPDTMAKWIAWAEASDEGLWEGDPEHEVRFSFIRSYGGEEVMDPPFFSIRDVEVSGDSIFIADASGCRVVCMGLDGSVIWTAGEQGEGPGHFNAVYKIAVNGGYVLVADGMLDKVEIMDRSGRVLDLVPVGNPTDVLFVDDSTFAVLSEMEPGGDVHVFAVSGEKLFSFGEAQWFRHPENVTFRMQDSFNALLAPDSVLLVSMWNTYHLYPCHLGSRTVGRDIAREYPTEVREPEFHTDGDQMGGQFYRNMGRLFVGPEGMLNVELANYTRNGQIRSAEDTTLAPVKLIDRYDWDWNYLDSYCLPLPGGVGAYSAECGFLVLDYETGALLRFTVQTGN
ncbi:MAG: hypothetical protein JXR55_10820 [Candidatus Fermentibacteraceae bacterium]|nr:hypothetical protein [Candidatus Fermentibacteraceae bacterium]